MEKLEVEIDAFLSRLRQLSENKHEILLGHCESELKLTSTQEHILMLLAEKSLTNSELAEVLSISAAAVSKALKKLQAEGLIASKKDPKDERRVLCQLTQAGLPIAKEHHQHHEKTLAVYHKIAVSFNEKEQATIRRFMEEIKGEFE
ncbi:zinc-dependent MarR family transcriptional regulator [Lactococcus termiticola]|uniref:MarR family transcriptional regulator n=1 Tax=Lactococcus termiticola TaxID=2169526 RepID=A0A2R5HF83_9LACT|nr:zinc-dependent MarR family transcriptional regulator [Lactococcus termiticola]GBG96496.1 MarR family transcriptional regulator [Lactococcus termiticola]